jgi:SAM-dependent methyltransferase
VLEFGCHLGATAIVLALMGARVTAIDVDPAILSLAGLNADRYGVADRIRFQALADSRGLPFGDSSFDVVVCNSVLEYVRHDWLVATEKELDRVLRPCGIAVIVGTSNRLWPREVHSRQWFSNYVPRALDDVVPWRLRRGVSQWSLTEGFEGYDDLLTADASKWIRLKQRMGLSAWRLFALHTISSAMQRLGLSPSALMPTLTMLLRKPAPT